MGGSTGMSDDNVEIGFIEYELGNINGTSVDSGGENAAGRSGKQPSSDKPPRNQNWADLGSMNETGTCTY